MKIINAKFEREKYFPEEHIAITFVAVVSFALSLYLYSKYLGGDLKYYTLAYNIVEGADIYSAWKLYREIIFSADGFHFFSSL